MQRDELGFLSSPANGLGIVRVRTILGNLRFWDVPRLEQALAIVIKEIGTSPIPGLYLLIDERSLNRYRVVTSATCSPGFSSQQMTFVDAFKKEINILLSNKGRVSRFIAGRRDDEVYLDQAKKILIRNGYRVNDWGGKYASIDNELVVIRPGSLKPKGWQVTFRGGKSLAQLKNGQGYLLMPRGKIVLLPLKDVAAFIDAVDHQAFNRDTVDIFVRFDEDKLMLAYKGQEKDITDCSVEPYSG